MLFFLLSIVLFFYEMYGFSLNTPQQHSSIINPHKLWNYWIFLSIASTEITLEKENYLKNKITLTFNKQLIIMKINTLILNVIIFWKGYSFRLSFFILLRFHFFPFRLSLYTVVHFYLQLILFTNTTLDNCPHLPSIKHLSE